MQVNTLSVPAREPMNRECVPQVARTRANTACRWFEMGVAKQPAQCAPCRRLWETASVCPDEDTVFGLRDNADEHASCAEVSSQLRGERVVERSPARAALRFGDEQDATAKIDIPGPEAQRFPEA